MKNQVNFLAFKAKKLLEKLKYLEINIKSFCSIDNMFSHDDFGRDNCRENYRGIPNFLWVYLIDNCSISNNPIETVIGINYKQNDYVYNLKLEDILKTTFFSKELISFHFYNQIKPIIDEWEDSMPWPFAGGEDNDSTKQGYFSEGLYDTKGRRMVVVAFENFGDKKKCEFSISYPTLFRAIFKSKNKLREIENLIIKEIQESVPYAKPKNLANYGEKIFDFLSNIYEYNSEFLDINKAYLGQNVENIYNLLLKENYNFSEKTQIQPIQNVFSFETYENLLKKFEKYGIKKLDLNIKNRDKFILSWFDKFGSEYRKYCSELFGKKGQFYYDNLNRWTNKIEFIYLLQILFKLGQKKLTLRCWLFCSSLRRKLTPKVLAFLNFQMQQNGEY